MAKGNRQRRTWPEDQEGRIDLKSMSLAELTKFVMDECGQRPSRGLEIYKWLWQRGARRVEDMKTLNKRLRSILLERAVLSELAVEQVFHSKDGTIKYLWRLHDGLVIESVLIPDGDRLTLCMSSQVGCAMGCTFCVTGDMGLLRNCTPAEIANQPTQVQRSLPEGARITNLVLMGMGEPLHNLDNLVTALGICLDDHGLNFSHRRVTVSTVGLVRRLGPLAEALPVNLAVSLNATTEEQRCEIMPVTQRHSLAELIEACRHFPLPPGKRITFEYVMFEGFNDSLDDAARLFELLRGIKAKVNLIPYNENPDRDLRRPNDETVKAFQHYFVERGLCCSIRTTRGTDIHAACGQLGKTHNATRRP